jgi:protocatechuate 3,4-dioxygenase, alpha subunit
MSAPVADGHLVPTPSQTIGPFLAIGMEPLEHRDVVAPGTEGAVTVGGTVLDGENAPVPDAMIELWQASPDGGFDATAGTGGDQPWFGRSLTDASGRYAFTTAKPAPVALRTGEPQAPHLELLLFARGLLRPVRTRVYFPDEAAANNADPVLRAVPPERRQTLVATPGSDGLTFDIRLRGAGETVFFAC